MIVGRCLVPAVRCLGMLLLLAATSAPRALPADDQVGFQVVPLDDHINHDLSQEFGDDGRRGNFLTVPLSEQTLDGVPFPFRMTNGVVQLGSRAWTGMPERVTGIRVERKFDRLHLLHATGYGGGPNPPGSAWHVADGTPIGHYRVNYADDTSVEIPIVYGEDVRDWWFREDEAPPNDSTVAWTGENELAKNYNCRLRLYHSTWRNPKPHIAVVSIDYIGRKDETAAAPFCAAMTVEVLGSP